MTQNTGPQRLSAALSELITLRGLARVRGNNQLQELWEKVSDSRWHARTRAAGVFRGVLHVDVDSAPLRSELQSYHKDDILQAVQAQAPHLNVRNLKFVLKRIVS